jgi:cob(I)alamin adenosyltransferase
MSDKNNRHQQRQEKIKQEIDIKIANATQEKGLFLVITGNGKGKSTSAFGTAARAVGHGQKVSVAQFIKGNWECGERNLLENAGAQFYVMSTDFTWETQNRDSDTKAAQEIWQSIKQHLMDEAIDLVVLDEITYMINYDYIDLDEVVAAINQRPKEQSVIITGRAAHRRLEELADTVSEIRNVKHAFDNGIKARKGIDW